jgi:hypothetical protein
MKIIQLVCGLTLLASSGSLFYLIDTLITRVYDYAGHSSMYGGAGAGGLIVFNILALIASLIGLEETSKTTK